MHRLNRFVQDPEALLLEPEILSAAPQLELRFAGITTAVSGLDSEASGVLQSLYAPGSPRREAGILLKAVPEAPARFRESCTIDWEPYLAVDSRPDQVCAAGYRWLLRLHRSQPLRATLWFDRTARGALAEDLWENVLRILMAYALLLSGGLLVHSAGVSLDGNGFLFPGASGDGKSSVAARCEQQGGAVFSDDCNAVLASRDGEPWRISGLPFGGELRPRRASPRTEPLAGVLSLRKASPTRVRPLTPAKAAARLMRAAPFVNGDPVVTGLVLRRTAEVVAEVPCGELAFSLDGDAVQALREFRKERQSVEPAQQ